MKERWVWGYGWVMEIAQLSIVPIDETNAHIFEVFEQDYEAEFSKITTKEPDVQGRFAIEADWKAPNSGLYVFIDDKPAGFVIKAMVGARQDIAEFYILPCYRKRGLGKKLAFAIFDAFPGKWQVRQIPSAIGAITFWRTIIQEYTQGHYTEDQVEDPHWGIVLRQSFQN